MKENRKKIIIITILFMFFCLLVMALLYAGILQCNYPSTKKYPVRGVDVSAYQGNINWDTLAMQNIQFAYIKATEGSSFVDKRFQKNYADARKQNIRVGAYHFFSFDSPGETQAINFEENVPCEESMLPPVVDVEFYGAKEKNPPQKASLQKELDSLLKHLEQHYGKKPVIYTTNKVYKLYIKDKYDDYDIWIRSVYCNPRYLGQRSWTFWQYSNRGRLAGYEGEEEFIDLNVFGGSAEEFETYGN